MTIPIKIIKKAEPQNEPQNEPQTREEKLLEIIKDNPTIRKVDMARIMDISPATLKRILSKLKDSGKIEYESSSRKGIWVIK